MYQWNEKFYDFEPELDVTGKITIKIFSRGQMPPDHDAKIKFVLAVMVLEIKVILDPIGATREIQRKIEMDRQDELYTRQQMARFAAMQQQPRRTVPEHLRRRPQQPPPQPQCKFFSQLFCRNYRLWRP